MSDLNQNEVNTLQDRYIFALKLSEWISTGKASLDKRRGNIIYLSSLLSNTFAIGRNDENLTPFIGVQEAYIPWFFSVRWSAAFLCLKEKYIYLVTNTNDGGIDFVIGLKVRPKRLSLLYNKLINEDGESKNQPLTFRIFMMDQNKGEIRISDRDYISLSLGTVNSIHDIFQKSGGLV